MRRKTIEPHQTPLRGEMEVRFADTRGKTGSPGFSMPVLGNRPKADGQPSGYGTTRIQGQHRMPCGLRPRNFRRQSHHAGSPCRQEDHATYQVQDSERFTALRTMRGSSSIRLHSDADVRKIQHQKPQTQLPDERPPGGLLQRTARASYAKSYALREPSLTDASNKKGLFIFGCSMGAFR